MSHVQQTPVPSQATSLSPGRSRETETTGDLVRDLTQQVSTLVRDELRLAQAEMTQKGKRAGLGIGLFSLAGLLGFGAFAVFVATAILALDLVWPAWLAALVVGLVLLAAAGVAALVGKREVGEATPPKPTEAIEGVKEDVSTLKRLKGEGSR